MSGIATAIVGGAIIGGIAMNSAAGKAADATQNATNASIAEQDKALQQQAALSQPYRDLGTTAIPTYQDLLTGGGDPAKVQKTLEALPGYQFTRDQGIEAAKRASAAGGLNLSGNQVADVTRYATGLADSTYSQRLMELLAPVQLGQAAAAGQAANIGTAAGNVSGMLINQGNTQAGIDMNSAAGLTKILGNSTNQLITQQTLAGLNKTPTYGGAPASQLMAGGTDIPTYDPALA